MKSMHRPFSEQSQVESFRLSCVDPDVSFVEYCLFPARGVPEKRDLTFVRIMSTCEVVAMQPVAKGGIHRNFGAKGMKQFEAPPSRDGGVRRTGATECPAFNKAWIISDRAARRMHKRPRRFPCRDAFLHILS